MIANPLAEVLPPDQANLILTMLLSIPLSFLMCMIYNKYLLLAVTMTLTMGFQSILFPNEKYFLWGQQQLVYLMILLVPRKIVGHVIIIESFTALIIIQLYRFYESYGFNHFDITGIFMMQLFNYISLGYNYQFGQQNVATLSDSQIKRRVVDRPSYITYLGFVNFMPACLVGPTYEFTDFEAYLNREGDYQNIPSTFRPFLKETAFFVISVVIYGVLSIFPLDYLLTPEFAQHNILYKLFYCVATITFIEFKYVSAWSLGMMSMRASGITYNPQKNVLREDGSVQYDFSKIEVNSLNFYLNPSMKVKADSWNISIQWALKRYIYENIYNPKTISDEKARKKRQQKAQLFTVLISALWHGLYFGYFISFVHWILFVQISQQIYRARTRPDSKLSKVYQKHKFLWDIVQNFFATFVVTFFGVTFHLMIWSRIKIFMYQTWCLPYIVLYLAFFLVVEMKVFSEKKKEGTSKLKSGQEKSVKSE